MNAGERDARTERLSKLLAPDSVGVLK